MKNVTEQQNVGTVELGDDNIEELLQKERDTLFENVFHDYCVSRGALGKRVCRVTEGICTKPETAI